MVTWKRRWILHIITFYYFSFPNRLNSNESAMLEIKHGRITFIITIMQEIHEIEHGPLIVVLQVTMGIPNRQALGEDHIPMEH